jgi:hypothetical protein
MSKVQRQRRRSVVDQTSGTVHAELIGSLRTRVRLLRLPLLPLLLGIPGASLAQMPVQPTPLPLKMGNGSLPPTCEDFGERITEEPLFPNMDQGEGSNATGYTTAAFGYTLPNRFGYSSNQTFYCGPLDKNFDDLATCLKECVVSLRAFTGICGPAQSSGANICAHAADPADAQVIPHGASYYWVWLAPAMYHYSKCQADITRYNGEAAEHEQLHINDANEIAAKATAALRGEISSMRACASSQQEASQLLTAQMQEAAQEAADQAEAKWEAKTQARDSEGLNVIPHIDCNDACPTQ